MADMDLREVLAEAMHAGAWPCKDATCAATCRANADRALARLSQPDVLDEFERRCLRHLEAGEWSPTLKARRVRLVLADMLGGES